MTDAFVSVVTALADDELIIGHRHSEWTGFAPYIEEDVAFSSIAQDEIGHASALFSLLAEATGSDADELALGRDAGQYTNALLCERENRDWAYTLSRHWLYERADSIRLEALSRTSHESLRALVAKIRREERYHTIHADTWLKRVSYGPVEGRTKLVDAFTDAFGETTGLFEPYELEGAALEQGILPLPSSELWQRFLDSTADALDELGLPTEIRSRLDENAEFVASSSGDLIAGEAVAGPAAIATGLGGRRGEHSPEFEILHKEMTSTYREHPGASW